MSTSRLDRLTLLLRLAAALLFGCIAATTNLGGQTSSLSPGGPEFNSSEASALVETINAELLGVMSSRRRAANLAQSPSVLESRIKQRSAALKAVMQSDPARALALALSDAELQRLRTSFPDSADHIEVHGRWVGQLERLIADNPESGQSWEIHRLRTPSGYLDVFWPEQDQYVLESGDTVEMSGVRIDSVIAGVVTEVSRPASAGSQCSTIGEQGTAVLLTTFPGVPLPQATRQQVRDLFFNPAGKSLDSYWRDASYGSTYASGDVFGWFTLDRDYNCNELGELREAAIQAADTQVDFRNYQRLFIIHPGSSQGCSFAGVGTDGCEDLASPRDGSFEASTSWLRARDTLELGVDRGVGVIVHEGGHNLGLQHASALDFGSIPLGDFNSTGEHYEYGDLHSTMGLDASLGHYSARHKLQLGWLTKETDVKTVEAPGSFVIRPLGSKELGLKAIRVRRKAGEQDWLWVQYRQPVGPFETAQVYDEVYEGAEIHYESPQNSDDEDAYPHRGKTYRLDFEPDSDQEEYDFRDGVILPGKEWKDPYSSQSIKVLSATADRLTVRIGPDTGCNVSLSPTSRTHPSSSDVGSFAVSAPQGCAWEVAPSRSWIRITSASSGTGPGTVTYSLDANAASTAREGEISVGVQPFSIIQDTLCRVVCSVTAPTALATGVAAQFRVSARVLNCSAAPQYSWEFGDGGVSALQAASHSYETAGLYEWTLETSAHGVICARSGQVEVSDPFKPPAIYEGGVVLSTLLPKVTAISPGSIISVFGEGFSTETILFPNLDDEGRLETSLGGVCLELNGERLPIFAVTPGQVNAQAPMTAAPGPARLKVITNCGTAKAATSQIVALEPQTVQNSASEPRAAESNEAAVAIESAAPAFFLFPPLASDGYIAARFNADAIAVAPHGMFTDEFGTSRPAKPGEIILLYGTGWGETTAALETGELATSAAELLPGANPTVTFGGVPMTVQDLLYVGLTPGTAGLYQLAIRVPAGAHQGNNQVVLSVYGRSTPVGPVVPVELP